MVRESQQANNDVIQIKALADTATATWSDECVKVYLNNYLAFFAQVRHFEENRKIR